MSYIDGFVAAVPTAKRDAFKKHAEQAAAGFKEYGALKVVECWGDDVPDGKLTSFPMAVRKKDDETVVFSWTERPCSHTVLVTTATQRSRRRCRYDDFPGRRRRRHWQALLRRHRRCRRSRSISRFRTVKPDSHPLRAGQQSPLLVHSLFIDRSVCDQA